jgi:hypothetical protein
MGHFHDPSNTFWELFLRKSGSTSWSLRTPPGVASNGGLVLAASPSGALTVGFLISADLKYSPVAQSSDGGDKWLPGELPSPLTSTPDALAVGPTGTVLALVGTRDQRVLEASGDLSDWRTLVTAHTLTHADPLCGVQAVTEVAYGPDTQPLLGLRCTQQGVVGIVAEPTGTTAWNSRDLALGSGNGIASITRLVGSAEGVTGLAELQSEALDSVIGFWSTDTSTRWARSARLAIPAGWSVRATGTGGSSGQGIAVLEGSGNRRRVEVLTGPGAPWVTLPPAPLDASGVSYVGAEVDTFVVMGGSHLVVWKSSEGDTLWGHSATITVPVPYGSSS